MQALVCDVCGGTLRMEAGGETAVCQYCGVQYTLERLREKIQVAGIATEENLLFRAQEFESEGNWNKAAEYYDRVLDLNPKSEIAKTGYKRVMSIQSIEVNDIYEGIVTRIHQFGCFVKLLPSGKEGFLHISRIAKYRLDSVEEVLSVGDKVSVFINDIDEKGRINLKRVFTED